MNNNEWITDRQETASFDVSRNDLCWSYYDSKDGSIRWWGYNDGFWWLNVAPSNQFRKQTGKITGLVYTLDPHSHSITISYEATP